VTAAPQISFAETISALGIALPVATSPIAAEAGILLDANGKTVLVVDVNNEIEDEHASAIAAMVVLAINTCAGYRAEAVHV